MLIRDATHADLPSITAIYAHHVLTSLGTFEEVPPEVSEMATRLTAIQGKGHPWLVAELEGVVAGYAYATPFRPRSAYRFSAEDSIYVAAERAGQGVGRALLEALIARCEAAGVRQMVAVIGDSGNAASIALHRALGFEHAGLLPAMGFKHGQWVDVVFMRRPLNGGSETLPGTREA